MYKHEIVEMANNEQTDYRDSDYLSYPYVFFTDSDFENTYIEICDEINWDRVVYIEKPIGERFTDDDIKELLKMFDKELNNKTTDD